MNTPIQSLANQAPLDCNVSIVARERKAFIDGPTGRTMIDDDVAGSVQNVESVCFSSAFIAKAEPHMAHYDVVRRNPKRRVPETDSIAWGRLSRNSQKRIPDGNIASKVNCSTNPKDDDPWSVGLAGCTEAARASIEKIAHEEHSAAAATRRGRAETLGAWKCGNRAWSLRKAACYPKGSRKKYGDKPPVEMEHGFH